MIDKNTYKGAITILIGTGLVAILIAGGFVVTRVLATDLPNVIHACYKNNNGQMRTVSDINDCLNSETPISWNQLGTQGSQGPQGPAGASGWEKVSSSITPDTTGFAKTTVAVCPSGKKVLGGGVRSLGGGSRKVIGSFPTGSGNGWIGEVAKSVSSDSLGLAVYAICADMN